MISDNNIDPMLTTSGVARVLSVHINTVRRWSDQGILESYRVGPRGDRRFRKEDIDNCFTKDDKGGVRRGLNLTETKVKSSLQ